jgi:hypothetical protein
VLREASPKEVGPRGHKAQQKGVSRYLPTLFVFAWRALQGLMPGVARSRGISRAWAANKPTGVLKERRSALFSFGAYTCDPYRVKPTQRKERFSVPFRSSLFLPLNIPFW